jgi:hypothetical protein
MGQGPEAVQRARAAVMAKAAARMGARKGWKEAAEERVVGEDAEKAQDGGGNGEVSDMVDGSVQNATMQRSGVRGEIESTGSARRGEDWERVRKTEEDWNRRLMSGETMGTKEQ